ncbi:hypothetical protein [uncultured Cedecea sp.]|uniref:hypothetical protein n=1 Tax=uncultured Cedecea sp. TaxID=988762 RepID=UPI00261A90CB|nr:hypothetical protein [uncultured Cedecea sp.]
MQIILSKIRDAESGNLGILSTGEALIAALVLNRNDWLSDMGYTVAQALERIGPNWSARLPEISQEYRRQEASVKADPKPFRETGEQAWN